MRGIVPRRVRGARRRPCYGPNMATPRSRHAARLRADRRRAQARARRFAVAAVIAVLAVATLALTAFDGESSPPAVSRPAPLPVTSAPPDSQVLATVGNLRVQSPVAQGGVTAIGFHGSAEGALELKPVGPQRNEGLLARLWRRITGASKSGLAWYQLSGGAAPHARRRGRRGNGRLRAGRRNRRRHPRPGRLRERRGLGDRAATDVGAFARGLDPERSPRPASSRSVRNVAAGASKLGVVTNISRYERQALARYAAEGGNNVAIQVYPSATLGVP